jgi:hypothetical protein
VDVVGHDHPGVEFVVFVSPNGGFDGVGYGVQLEIAGALSCFIQKTIHPYEFFTGGGALENSPDWQSAVQTKRHEDRLTGMFEVR